MPEKRLPAVLSALRNRSRSAVDFHDLVYLVCPAGFPNYGDELIAEAWLKYLARHRPLAAVVVDSPRPGQAGVLLRHANPRAVFVNTLWELTLHAERSAADQDYIDAERPWEWVAEASSRYGLAPREGHGVELLLRAKTIHLLGGGYVNDVWPHHVSLVAAIAEVSRQTGARAVASGLGLTPLLTGSAWDRLVADAAAFDVFDTRDQASFDALDGVPSRSFTGDDAWVSPRLKRPRRPVPPTGEVVLCTQQDLTDDFAGPSSNGIDGLVEFVRDTLDAWETPGSSVTVVECIPGLDNTVAQNLGDRLDGARRISFYDVWRDGLPTGQGHTWLSTRFHPHLLAAAAGDSGVAVVPKPDYYGTKHNSLIDAGSRWTVATDGRSIPPWPTAGGFPVDRVEEAVAAKRGLAKKLYPAGIGLR